MPALIKAETNVQKPLGVQLYMAVTMYCNWDFFPLSPFGDRIGWVYPLSSKLVKQSQIVQSAMYSCDTVITTKVLNPAVQPQFVLTLVVSWGFSLAEY